MASWKKFLHQVSEDRILIGTKYPSRMKESVSKGGMEVQQFNRVQQNDRTVRS